MNASTLILATLVSLGAPAGEPQKDGSERAPPPRVTLSEGPAARAWAGVGPDTRPRAPDPGDLEVMLADPRGERAETWLAWAADVRAEAEAETSDPARRVRLALFARLQSRSDDAWDHLAACTSDPERLAGALPAMLPGIPLESLDSFARGEPLPAGLILRPSLPPPPTPAYQVVLGTGRVQRRSMSIEGLPVGGALLGMTVTTEVDGVQVDVTHRSGPASSLSVELPVPPDFDVRVEYIDWFRQDTLGQPLSLELAPGGEPRTLFGRFRPRKIDWPTSLPTTFTQRLEAHGLRLAHGVDDPAAARLEGLAAALALVFDCPVQAHELDPAAAPEPWPGITLNLFEHPDRERKLAGMISLAERFALSGRAGAR